MYPLTVLKPRYMTRISWRVNFVNRHRSSSATGIGFGARVGSSSYTTSSMGLSGGVAIFALTSTHSRVLVWRSVRRVGGHTWVSLHVDHSHSGALNVNFALVVRVLRSNATTARWMPFGRKLVLMVYTVWQTWWVEQLKGLPSVATYLSWDLGLVVLTICGRERRRKIKHVTTCWARFEAFESFESFEQGSCGRKVHFN